MQIQNRDSVGDFAIQHAGGHNDATLLDRLVVDGRFVLVYVITEQAMPQTSFPYARGNRVFAACKTIFIEDADIGICEAACLQGLNSGLGVSSGVEDSY